METIIARYFVCDCEHQGDIDYACSEIRDLGGKIIKTEWDGHDCGEASVYCEIDKATWERLKDHEMEWQSCEYLRDFFKAKKLL